MVNSLFKFLWIYTFAAHLNTKSGFWNALLVCALLAPEQFGQILFSIQELFAIGCYPLNMNVIASKTTVTIFVKSE
jgi:hypothetical protein